MFVAVVGPDGVGKTTFAGELINSWQGETRYIHFRPRLGVELAVAPPSVEPPPPPKAPKSGSVILGWLRLALGLVRFWTGYLVKVRPAVRRGALVVADRWAYVFEVQPYTARFYGPKWLPSALIRFFPRPTVVFNLQAPPDVVRQRKQELDVEEIAAELEAWTHIEPGRRIDIDATMAEGTMVEKARSSLAEAGQGYKRYPPGRGIVWIPQTSRSAAAAGVALYPVCKPRARTTQRALYAAVGSIGPSVIPGQRVPSPVDDWVVVAEDLRDRLGPFDDCAFVGRLQSARQGWAALLLSRGSAIAFVKVRPDVAATALETEARALQLVSNVGPTHFRAPQVLGSGTAGNLAWLALSALPDGLHHFQERLSLDGVIDDIHESLSTLQPVSGNPSHWVPMHGDLTPWNLRRCSDGSLWLFDWEDAGWGPPGADRLRYDAVTYSLGGRYRRRGRTAQYGLHGSEAARFWLDRQPPEGHVSERRSHDAVVEYLNARLEEHAD